MVPAVCCGWFFFTVLRNLPHAAHALINLCVRVAHARPLPAQDVEARLAKLREMYQREMGSASITGSLLTNSGAAGTLAAAARPGPAAPKATEGSPAKSG